MQIFEPQHNISALKAHLREHPGLAVVCYCAAWCDTCTEYRPAFDDLAARMPEHTFIWVDIEENPELLGDDDVENFPTLLLQDQRGSLFFGTLLPHISHLERLIASMDDDAPLVEQSPGALLDLLEDA
ncbi:thioredoxin family protein [Pusillimonas sp. MFBS29]|uniref:thioredoxin family protein n=1 Tax=Pusillimonas sp. MFBS29 TaxID=2886690 RepID=UPI001D10D9BB|nr:thioredoxin family protein [Pusillimonas sp. MFBS29]MCC2594960.1 thioredoxin family protein [Pusillimonas sp. MFBS29]